MNRRFATKDGEQRDETCFVDVTMWGRRAEVISEYFTKGRPIFVEGRLKFDTWETSDGQKRSKLRVAGERMQMLGGRSSGPSGGRPQTSQQESPYSEADPGPAGHEAAGPGGPPAEDDIPF